MLKINGRVFNNRASVFTFTFYLSAEAANTNGNMDQHHLMDHKSFSKLNQKLNALHSHRHTTLSLHLINTIWYTNIWIDFLWVTVKMEFQSKFLQFWWPTLTSVRGRRINVAHEMKPSNVTDDTRGHFNKYLDRSSHLTTSVSASLLVGPEEFPCVTKASPLWTRLHRQMYLSSDQSVHQTGIFGIHT